MPNTLLATDSFTSGSLAAGWTALPTFQKCQVIVGTPNVAEANATSVVSGQTWTGLTWPVNQVSEATLHAYVVGGSPQLSLLVRQQTGTNSYYNAIIFNGKWQINITTAGAGSKLTSGYATTLAGDTWSFQANGSQLSLFQNGNLVGSIADTTYASGNPGFWFFTATLANISVSTWNGYSIPDPGAPSVTPFSQTIVRDTFTRANSGTLGANWTAQSDATDVNVLGITSNAAEVQTANGGRAASFWNANTFQPNQYSQVLVGGSATGTNSHVGGVTVRNSAGGNYYAFTWDLAGTALTNFKLYKVVGGTLTDIGGVALQGPTPSSGSLLRLEVVGTELFGYVDGTIVYTTVDTSLLTGAPGVTGLMTTSTPTAFMTNWEGGSIVWTKQGTAIPTANGGALEPSVVYEANPQILSPNADGKIWKMWYVNGWTNPTNVFYQESSDGLHWTPYASNPVISDGTNNLQHGFVFHFGSTYYAYVGNDLGVGTGTAKQIDLFQSSDGVTGWTKTNSAVLTIGAGGAWDNSLIANPVVFVQSGTWYMIYIGTQGSDYHMGLATSPDGVTWTKYSGNPIISTTGAQLNGKTITLSGGLYYLWGYTDPVAGPPSDISMWSSPDLHTWTACTRNPVYIRVLSGEGANVASGQVADPCLVELNGTTYMFHDAVNSQSAGNAHINVATAPFSISQLNGMIFGQNIISGNAGVAGALISYSGTASGSVTADSLGNYVIPIASNGSYTITPSSAGLTFTPASSDQTVSGADITGVNFTASTGANVYSVPDCRVAPFGPNASRTVQSTKIFDVQTSDNSAIPPVDSRSAGAPVDSRDSGNAPQNSRTPGTFGPGVN